MNVPPAAMCLPNVPVSSMSPAPSNPGRPKEPWELDPTEIKLCEKIGSGSFGDVWRGEWAGIEVAVKKITKASITDKDIQSFRDEVDIMSKLRHPNVVQFLGACLSPEIMLVTEYASRGSLFGLLQNKNNQISWGQAVRISLDIAKGILYLHTRNPPIVHRDIKSLNILVMRDWKAVVADFGLTKIKKAGYLDTYCGSPAWTAPEVLRGQQYDESADVYSFGVVLWEILTRQAPYPGVEPSVIIGRGRY